MTFLSGLVNTLSGGLANVVADTIKAYFPPDMTPQQQAELKLALERLEFERTKEANAQLAEAERAITERIAMLEGTAADLKTLPILGPIMIFLRGLQRPFWGYAVIYADAMWFSGRWGNLSQTQESALWIINLLVLGFLFGERAVQNLAPIIGEMLAKRGKAG